MNSFNNILDMFPSMEMKEKINDIIIVINELSQKTPVVGFHHTFYVPGWIGFFQIMAVENKMNKFASQPFCRNMYYFEFGDWIINKSREMMDGQKMEAFKLDLSFIGWFALSLLTLGLVGVFWTNPYFYNTNAALYRRLNGEDAAEVTAAPADEVTAVPAEAE